VNGFVFAESIFWGSTTAGKLIPLNREWFCICRIDLLGINKRSAVNPDFQSVSFGFVFVGVIIKGYVIPIKDEWFITR
jgi:hypothetical protein